MQFRIPQFLDIEDQVFGPFTFKQFGYLLSAIAFAYIFWKLIPYTIIAIFFILIFSGTFLALAFVKINTRPFADILEAAYKFIINNKTYVWQKSQTTKTKKEEIRQQIKETEIKQKQNLDTTKKISNEEIKALANKLDILKKEEDISLRNHLLQKVGKNNI